MLPLIKQSIAVKNIGNTLKAVADTAADEVSNIKNTLKGSQAADAAKGAIGAGDAASKGSRFKNWVMRQSKPFATAVAINTAAGGFPVYQTAQSLRKLLAGKSMRFTNDRIAALEKALETAKDYERAPLISKLDRYKSINGLSEHYYKKRSYPGIWWGAALSVPAAYGAQKLWDWVNWAALDGTQRAVLTAQGENPTTPSEDLNSALSRAASYWNGIKSLPEVFGAANKRTPAFKNINTHNPYAYAAKANNIIQQQELRAASYPWGDEFGHDPRSLHGDRYDNAPAYRPVEPNYERSMFDQRSWGPYDYYNTYGTNAPLPSDNHRLTLNYPYK
jgi:hypothetical protein